MKKIICFLLAIAYVVSQAIISYADDINPVYASKSIQSDIQTNMYEETSSYNFLFGTKNVRFDFNSAIPVYCSGKYNQEISYSSFSELIFFTERYAVPVYNNISNKFLGLARFGKIVPYNELHPTLKEDEYYANLSLHHEGEWELKSFSSDNYYENLLYQIENNKNPANKVYYVEIMSLDRYGLLYVSNNEDGEVIENFLDVSNTDNVSTYSNDDGNSIYISGAELLREIDYVTTHTNDDEVTGYGNINSNASIKGNGKSYSVNWTVAPNKTLKSANTYSLKAGDIIKFNIAISPAMNTSELKIGIYNVDTETFTYFSHASTSLSGKYTIKTDGNYKFTVKNLSSDTTATISGNYNIE